MLIKTIMNLIYMLLNMPR